MRLLDFLLGRKLANKESRARKIGAVEAVPAMGLDALASSAYGLELVEDWILGGWDAERAQNRPYRYPTKIQGWRFPPDGSMPAARFVAATVEDIQINVGADPDRFRPPAK